MARLPAFSHNQNCIKMKGTHPPVPFEKLLEQFLEIVGQDPSMANGSMGFEFESGTHTARFLPDSETAEGIVIEVDAHTLGEEEKANALLLMMLHRLNEASRTEHSWAITVDVEDRVLISTRLPISGIDGSALQKALCESLDRAESLTALIEQFSQGASRGVAPELSENVNLLFNPLKQA